MRPYAPHATENARFANRALRHDIAGRDGLDHLARPGVTLHFAEILSNGTHLKLPRPVPSTAPNLAAV